MRELKLATLSGIEGNLPPWEGASHCYSRAYRMLENMARRGHATPGIRSPFRHMCVPGSVSPEMQDLIDALNKGDEEQIKFLLMLYADRGFEEKGVKVHVH